MAWYTTYRKTFTFAGSTQIVELQEDLGSAPLALDLPMVGKDWRINFEFSDQARGLGVLTYSWRMKLFDDGSIRQYLETLDPSCARLKVQVGSTVLCYMRYMPETRSSMLLREGGELDVLFQSKSIVVRNRVGLSSVGDPSIADILEDVFVTIGGYNDVLIVHDWNSTAWTPNGPGNSNTPFKDLYVAQAKESEYSDVNTYFHQLGNTFFWVAGWSFKKAAVVVMEYGYGRYGEPNTGYQVVSGSSSQTITVQDHTISTLAHKSDAGTAMLSAKDPYGYISITRDGGSASTYIASSGRDYLDNFVFDVEFDTSAKASADTDGMSAEENTTEFAAGNFENVTPHPEDTTTAYSLNAALKTRMQTFFASERRVFSGLAWKGLIDPMIPVVQEVDGTDYVWRVVHGHWDVYTGSTWIGRAIEIGEDVYCGEPTSFTASDAGSGTVDLSWTAPSGEAPDEYNVEAFYQGSGGYVSVTDTASTTAQDTGVAAGTHSYRVRSKRTGDNLTYTSPWVYYLNLVVS